MLEREQTEFNLWLEQRQKHFNEQGLIPAEIAIRALEHGFHEAIVRAWEQTQRAIDNGSRYV